MTKQLYDYWFVQFDFPDANGNPYKSSGGKMVWNEKLKRELPEGWKDVCFKDICNVKRGASPRPIDEYMDQSHNGIPWVKISDATSSESPFLTLVKEYIIPEGGRHSVHVSPNTLIVSNSASPGIPKFIEIDACVHDGWLILTGYKEYYRYYFYYIIHMIRHNLLHMASGSIFKNLKTDHLKEYVCLNPPQKVLQDYDKIVHPLMSSLLGKQLEIEELTKERDRLLALFMAGQVSVKQLNNDLASHILLPYMFFTHKRLYLYGLNITHMKEPGYVYILTNPSFKEDWVKIGKSSRPVNVRSKELDNTAVPLPFEIFATMKTVKYNEAEKLIHRYIERFTNLRIRDNREFFNVKPEDALAIFRDVAMVLDDAEIDEVYKKSVTDDVETHSGGQRIMHTPLRSKKIVWMVPANSKFFDLAGCLEKYG